MKLPENFLIGTATSAHQVEGNNTNSDLWVQEHCKYTQYKEPSGITIDHYNRYEEDIALMAKAGLNAYRFSIEWARIEPQNGVFDEKEVAHYSAVLDCCKKYGIEPIVTLHHFSSPKWLITEGGWECEKTVEYFARYASYVAEKLGDKLNYVCTINEANMGVQMSRMIARMMKQSGGNLQVGFDPTKVMAAMMAEQAQAFGVDDPQKIACFLSPRTEMGDKVIIKAHLAAKHALKEKCPHIKVGWTLSLHDIQVKEGGEEEAKAIWNEEFMHYVPFIKNDDFIGVQNYTREIIGANGIEKVPEGCPLTQMDYEDYPQALGHVISRVAEELTVPILVTECGIATDDDKRRQEFIDENFKGIEKCLNDGIDIKGYMYWSFADNFEFAKAYAPKFGVVAVDRTTQKRLPKESLYHLGKILKKYKGKAEV